LQILKIINLQKMLNKVITEDNIQKAKKLVLNYDKIVIITHLAPDGDGMGSSLVCIIL